MTKAENPFRYFNSSPEVIRLVVLMYVRFPLSLRKVWASWAPPETCRL
jgi:putative transposase